MAAAGYPEALAEALEAQVRLGDAIEESDLALASSCAGWRIRDVLNHSVAVTLKFAAFARGETDRPRTPPGDHLRDDHRAALRTAATTALVAWNRVDPDRTCHLPFGTFPASTAAGINLFDVLAHCWDVAGPTGNSLSIPDHLWTTGSRAARAVIGEERDHNHFGPPLEIDTISPRAEFLAFLGRADVDVDPPPDPIRATG